MKNLNYFTLILVVILCSSKYLIAQSPTLWGVTTKGGTDGNGNIFSISTATASITNNFIFTSDITGCYVQYTQLCEANNGKIYGLASGCGTHFTGVLFEYDPSTSIYTKKIDFKDTTMGSNPNGSLIKATNGKLYGMTLHGGSKNDGVLFEYDPSANTYTKKFDFDAKSTGCNPYGSLVEATNGKLYGMTFSGGTEYYGVLFEYDLNTSIYTKKIDFDGTDKGRFPTGTLLQANNGKLYGVTASGGANGNGVLFEFDPNTNTYIKKLDFNGTNNGSYPNGNLIQVSNGKLYGLANSGGTKNYGVLFEYDTNTDTYTKKMDFDDTNKGRNPIGSLIQATNGKLYGMANGGKNNNGVIFEYNLSTNTYIKKLDFDGETKGRNPYGSFMQASNGKLYGMTNAGGINDYGVLFEYNINTDIYTKKMDFSGFAGSNPTGSLTLASNGMLYGMTNDGGPYNYGILYEYNSNTGIYRKKMDFDAISGSNPPGNFVKANNSKLYAMTNSGGSNALGVLFEYDPNTNIYTKKIDFDKINTGRYPLGSLIQATNGKLYGMTYGGGINNVGVLFEYNLITNTFTKKLDFDGTDKGSYPYANLIQANNGKIYGMTALGGLNDLGILFEYEPTIGLFIKKIDFDGVTKGSNPIGSLMQASNDKLYGMTYYGGTTNNGVLFEYEPTIGLFTKILDFNGINGKNPSVGALLEVKPCLPNTRSINVVACNNYVFNSRILTASGVYTDTLSNICEEDSIITLNLTINTVDADIIINDKTLSATAIGAAYQWYDCTLQQVIAKEINKDYTPKNSGNYAVIVTQNNCTDTSNCVSVISTKVNQLESIQNLQLYPNPTPGNSTLTYTLMESSTISLEIYNIFGILVQKIQKSEKQGAGEYQLNMNIDLPSATYWLRIQTNKGVTTHPFVLLRE